MTDTDSPPSDNTGDSAPEMYADAARLSLGPFGIGIEFGVIPFPDQAGNPATQVKPVIRLRVSPQMAYALQRLLEQNLATYRSLVGDFALPDHFINLPPEPVLGQTETVGKQYSQQSQR